MALMERIAKLLREPGPPGNQVAPGMPGDVPKKLLPFDEFGVSGLLRTRGVGYVYEEWLADLSTARAKQVYREMRDNDPVIGALFFALEMILRRAEWRVEAAPSKEGEKVAEFVKSCMDDMSHTWEDFVAEATSMFAFGFSLFETVYKRRQGSKGKHTSRHEDGLVGWRKFAPRAQESILYWVWDDEGGLQGAVQLAAPDYRTVTIPIEKLLLFRTTSLKNNPEGRSVLRNCYRCFDDETEILTRDGWKLGLDVTASDEVAVLKNGELHYETPSAVHRYDYKGDLFHFTSRALDQMVTPNHEVWVRREHKDAYERVRADCASLRSWHKRDAAWVGKEVASHTVPAYDVLAHEQNGRINVREHRESIEIPMDDWLAFLGIYIAEGYTSGGKALLEKRDEGRAPASVVICQNEGGKADAIRRILGKIPFHVYEHTQERPEGKRGVRFTICNRQLWDHLRGLGGALGKHVPSYVKDLSPRQIAIFLDAFHLGDGGFSGNQDDYEGTRLYFTASKLLADDLSELTLKAGGCPTVKLRESPPEHARFSSRPMYIVTHGRQPESRPREIAVVPYEGVVWCVTTSAGVVYTRRNGKCQWSGNSWFFKKRLEEIEGIGIERNLCGVPVLYMSAEALEQMTMNGLTGAEAAKKLVRDIRVDDQAGIVLPAAYDDKGNPLVKLELMRASGGTRNADASRTIGRYNSDILNTMLAGFVQFGQTPTGSRSLHVSATQIFSLAIGSYMDALAAVINRHAIPRLMAMNKMNQEDAPTLKAGDIGVRDLAELGSFVQQMAGTGINFTDRPTVEYLRKAARLPDPPEEGEEDALANPLAAAMQGAGGENEPGMWQVGVEGAEEGDEEEEEEPVARPAPKPGARPQAAQAPEPGKEGGKRLQEAP